MGTLYVVPNDCPFEDSILRSPAWEIGAIKLSVFEALSYLVSYPKELEVKYNKNVFLSWTCAGCSVGEGNGERTCSSRQIGMGGKEINMIKGFT